MGHHPSGGHEREDYIAAGQFRSGEQLIDPQNLRQPGTILAFLEPLYKDGLEGVTPGSSCIVNAYTSNHDVIADPATGAFKGFALHAVDATGIVHALLLRIQALLLPVKTLMLSGHCQRKEIRNEALNSENSHLCFFCVRCSDDDCGCAP